jgi:hypothetical protein
MLSVQVETFFNKTTIHVLRLTQLYNILLLFYYWLLVSASIDLHWPIFTKNLKMPLRILQKSQFYGISFTFIKSLYKYYQLLDVLSVVNGAEIP